MSEPTRIETPMLDAMFDEVSKLKCSESFNRGVMAFKDEEIDRLKGLAFSNAAMADRRERERDQCRDALSKLVAMVDQLTIPFNMDAGPIDQARRVLDHGVRTTTETKAGKVARCRWQGFASGLTGGCVLPFGHQGGHKFADGSGGGSL